MANSKPTRTTLKKGDNLPPRGRSNKTIILEVLRERGHLSLTEKSTKEEAEKAFFNEVAKSAFNIEDPNRGMCLKLLTDKGWASLKPTSEMIEFDFDENAPMFKQATQVLKGVASGDIPPDLGNSFLNSITNMLKIQEVTDIDERLKKMEEQIESVE